VLGQGPGLIPTGEVLDVAGSPFDFRSPKPLGRDLDAVAIPGCPFPGYDHYFPLEGATPARAGSGTRRRPVRAALARDPASGRRLEVLTTCPGFQLYSGNFLAGERGKPGAAYRAQGGFCVEPSLYPDAPNRPAFPSAVLRPGETYDEETVYRVTTG
jgi:aldose 1-epimerase